VFFMYLVMQVLVISTCFTWRRQPYMMFLVCKGILQRLCRLTASSKVDSGEVNNRMTNFAERFVSGMEAMSVGKEGGLDLGSRGAG
jgi:hypothetical protein